MSLTKTSDFSPYSFNDFSRNAWISDELGSPLLCPLLFPLPLAMVLMSGATLDVVGLDASSGPTVYTSFFHSSANQDLSASMDSGSKSYAESEKPTSHSFKPLWMKKVSRTKYVGARGVESSDPKLVI
ncbi:hypothetical protein CVT25_006083 [Psilocybe cyanescens]|uniref:Uncharacterized protein n=1 Tax=Psilocybe cyanescens TaxID=93625 RepID=A0A409X9U8_PSICY|nr:hypothetical protein CVT25_006083 [Psilocybe cyanescens]